MAGENEAVQAVMADKRVRLTWDTHTALAVIVVGSLAALAMLRGSLSQGGAVQP